MIERLPQIVPVVFLAVVITWLGIVPALTTIDTDFPNYYTASHLVLAGTDCSRIYDDAWFSDHAVILGLNAEARFTPFPPATAFVMLPVAWLAPLAALQAWTLINIIVLMLVIVMIGRITEHNLWWSALLVLFSGRALINNFKFGQLYLLLLLAVLLIYRGMQRDRSIGAGVALGLGAAIKYFPIIYFVPFVQRKQWRTIIIALCTLIGVAALAYGVIGARAHYDFVARIVFSHLNGEIPGQTPFAASFESWNSLLRRLFVFDPVENPTPWIAWPTGVAIVRTAVMAAVALATVYGWRVVRGSAQELPMRCALITLAALVLLPATATYHFLLLIFPVALLLAPHDKRRLSENIIIAAYVLIAFLPLAPFHNLQGHGVLSVIAYPRLWLVTVIFIVAVMRASELRAAADRNRA